MCPLARRWATDAEAQPRDVVRAELLENVGQAVVSPGTAARSQPQIPEWQIEVVENGAPRVYSGRLVRVQRMSEKNTGFAVEFDRD